jgi:transcriptional regulator of arginine metabolism
MISAPARNGAAAKAERQRAILELVRTRIIRTQEDLVAALRRRRVFATQATVSRDIRDLGLLRVHDDAGARYVAAAAELDPGAAYARVRRALAEHVRHVEFVDLLGIVHTAPGSASLVAAALDAGRFEELAGTLAGDDTVLIVARSRPAAQRLLVQLKHMMGSP